MCIYSNQNNTNITELCDLCKDDYMNLNTIYDSAKGLTCFDIQDLVSNCYRIFFFCKYVSSQFPCTSILCYDIKMITDAIFQLNKTRHNWSSNLKCCKDKDNTSTTMFIAVSSSVIPMVALFYVGFFIYKRRRRQYDEIITSPAENGMYFNKIKNMFIFSLVFLPYIEYRFYFYWGCQYLTSGHLGLQILRCGI